MGVAAAKQATDRAVEIRVRFEPGLGAALYASLQDGEVSPVTVAKVMGRGRALLRYHGYTLMAHGAPDWKAGDSFSVTVKQIGPPLVLEPVAAGAKKRGGMVTTVETAVVPGGTP
jgi:predicted RNA-binding protein with TRAM domain